MSYLNKIIEGHSMTIFVYAVIITLIITIIIWNLRKKKKSYLTWKKDKVNLYFFSREWERNEDIVLNELFNENIRLENELKVRKKDHTKITLAFLVVVAGQVLADKLKRKEKKTS
jgi:hypothetical protein